MSQTQNSTKHRYSRLRARTFLLDVFTGLSSEVFLLCTLAVSITDLSKISHKNIFPTLREWWKTASHPRGLIEVANELCAANSIGTLATPPKKRQSSEDFIGVRAPFIPMDSRCLLNSGSIVEQAYPIGIRSVENSTCLH